MRRIALLSDIHGNISALDSVLADIARCGLEERYCLGDLVGYGPDPAGAVDRIRALAIPTVLGNYDDGVGTRRGECGCYYATAQARADGAASYVFTDRAIDDERAAWLAALPRELRLEEGAARILLTHGSPRRINEYLLPDRTDGLLARLADEADADVVCVGHVHVPYHRTLTGGDGRPVHYVNSGSVGKPKDGDPRACWVEVVIGTPGEVEASAPDDTAAGPADAMGTSLSVRVHRVAYDIDGTVDAMRRAGLPDTLMDALRRA